MRYLSPQNQLNSKKQYAADLEERLMAAMKNNLSLKKHKLELLAGTLDGLSPLKKMSQGFSFVSDLDGNNIHDVTQVSVGAHLKIQMTNGSLEAVVEKKEEFRRNPS